MGVECLKGKGNLRQRVEKALSINPEYTPSWICVKLNNLSGDEFMRRFADNTLEYPAESVSRAVRKARQENESLRDAKHLVRQFNAEHIRTEIVKGEHMNDYKINQGSFL